MLSLWMRFRSGFFFQANTDGGTTGTDPGSTDDSAKAKKDDAATDQTDSKSGKDAKDKKEAATFQWSAEQQAEIDRIMGETRKQERKKAKADFDADLAKAQKNAEDKELAEKQEFKTLADKRQTEIETLQTQIEELTQAKEQGQKYKAALEAHLKAQTEKLPKHIKELLSKSDVLEQMEFLTKNAKDLGVKLDSVDETPRDNAQSESELEASQSKDLRRQVKSWI
jgi:chromosome segregation ATPase